MSTQWALNGEVEYEDIIVSSANPIDHIRVIFTDPIGPYSTTAIYSPNSVNVGDTASFQGVAGTYTFTIQAEDSANSAIGTPIVTAVTLPPSNASISGVSVRVPKAIAVGIRATN